MSPASVPGSCALVWFWPFRFLSVMKVRDQKFLSISRFPSYLSSVVRGPEINSEEFFKYLHFSSFFEEILCFLENRIWAGGIFFRIFLPYLGLSKTSIVSENSLSNFSASFAFF
ncbi:hypothetical protein CH373_16180 [Leptospira perolatii]|uniref:Uncharacterized protein n=1 Tax=Leptospira perolatii TaxID=2023191 RepID=A0A2M9ZJK0_9LEPT|nr:hypothetical protein CH360_16380 [Leptospira perolatii]PJZ72133.1 hypothetical protein CH373_16180 [Leptospira perolatii]